LIGRVRPLARRAGAYEPTHNEAHARRAGEENTGATASEAGHVVDDPLRTSLFHPGREPAELTLKVTGIAHERARRLRASIEQRPDLLGKGAQLPGHLGCASFGLATNFVAALADQPVELLLGLAGDRLGLCARLLGNFTGSAGGRRGDGRRFVLRRLRLSAPGRLLGTGRNGAGRTGWVVLNGHATSFNCDASFPLRTPSAAASTAVGEDQKALTESNLLANAQLPDRSPSPRDRGRKPGPDSSR
jgi:hypothetical protein